MEIRGLNGELLVIERSALTQNGAPADKDLLLNVTIKVRGYSAADQAMVASDDWHAFMTELRELERLRRGQSTLTAANPRDLKLVFKAMDRAGHMAITGFLGWDTSESFYQKLEFGFDFDGGTLQGIVVALEELGL